MHIGHLALAHRVGAHCRYGAREVPDFVAQLIKMHCATDAIKKVNTDMLCDTIDEFHRRVVKSHAFALTLPHGDHIINPLGRIVDTMTDLSQKVAVLREKIASMSARFSTGGQSAGQTLESIREFTKTVVMAHEPKVLMRKLSIRRSKSSSLTKQSFRRESHLRKNRSRSGSNISCPADFEARMISDTDSIFSSPDASARAAPSRGQRGGRIGSRHARLKYKRTSQAEKETVPE